MGCIYDVFHSNLPLIGSMSNIPSPPSLIEYRSGSSLSSSVATTVVMTWPPTSSSDTSRSYEGGMKTGVQSFSFSNSTSTCNQGQHNDSNISSTPPPPATKASTTIQTSHQLHLHLQPRPAQRFKHLINSTSTCNEGQHNDSNISSIIIIIPHLFYMDRPGSNFG